MVGKVEKVEKVFRGRNSSKLGIPWGCSGNTMEYYMPTKIKPGYISG